MPVLVITQLLDSLPVIGFTSPDFKVDDVFFIFKSNHDIQLFCPGYLRLFKIKSPSIDNGLDKIQVPFWFHSCLAPFLQNIINKNLSDPEFNVDQLSRKLYMSHATLYRKIHALTGETPTDFIRSCRLKRGVELLKSSYGNVGDVAFEVGFSSTSYFIKCFKEKFHRLPSSYMVSD